MRNFKQGSSSFLNFRYFFSSPGNGDDREQEGADLRRPGVSPRMSELGFEAPRHHHLVEERQVPAAVDVKGGTF